MKNLIKKIIFLYLNIIVKIRSKSPKRKIIKMKLISRLDTETINNYIQASDPTLYIETNSTEHN